jgi:hypothetical protein
VVAIPEVITADLASHIVTYAAPGDDGACVHQSPRQPAEAQQFLSPRLAASSSRCRAPDDPLHDLRHTGNQLAANADANLRELMARMGHSTTRAAMPTCTAVTSGSRPSRTS